MSLKCEQRKRYMKLIKAIKEFSENSYASYEMFKSAIKYEPMTCREYEEAIKLAAVMFDI
ncbi:MAG TPA: hypothetical protein PKL77_06095 [Candidatus Omnitrophota bacterium]|nr:hypothetical protein [Candidatus Omnitrophota bacterium]